MGRRGDTGTRGHGDRETWEKWESEETRGRGAGVKMEERDGTV